MVNLMNWIKKKFGQDTVDQTPNPVIETHKGWTVFVKGTVKTVSRTDVDKSGRNPKYMYSFTVEHESIDYENCEFELEGKIRFRVKEKQVIQALGREIKREDRVEITSVGIERRPRTLSVNKISLLSGLA